MENGLTPIVASLIFATSRALNLPVEERRAELADAIARDDLFPKKFGAPMPTDDELDSTRRWEERYARLAPNVRDIVVREAVTRLSSVPPAPESDA